MSNRSRSTTASANNEIVNLDAIPLSEAIQARDVSCREVMQAYIDHIDRINPKHNALISLAPAEQLLSDAEEKDRMLDKGNSLGWMHGIPQAVKDLAACNGFPTSFGSPIHAGEIADYDAISVSRVRDAGAIFIGKTNVPEFGLGSQSYNSVFGTTLNAYSIELTAGGSSGGAAVALALRLLPVADGSDMMGSLRNPAAFNNVYGFRPSFGRVPFGPTSELFSQQLATEGPMGRSVADVAALLRTQAGPHPSTPHSLSMTHDLKGGLQRDFRGTRIGWLGNFNGYLPMEPGVLQICEKALEDFKALGCNVEECTPDFDMPRLWKCWLVHRSWLIAGILGQAYSNPLQRDLLKPEAIWEVEKGRRLSASEVYQASLDRSDWYRAIGKLFERYDYLLLPSAQVFPFDARCAWPQQIQGREMDTYHRWMEVMIGASLAGIPAMSAPIGFSTQGLPMGMQIMGPVRGDQAVLQLAFAHEQATQWVKKFPPPLNDNRC